jgi:Clp amino terminal domain, pathogenicity island component/Antitoxin FitA-like, ribbon-helix-helix
MATLHVRSVPDDLYELLREQASANARSIGAEVVQLLYERLAGDPPEPLRRFPSLGRRRHAGPGLFTRFSSRARGAVAAAQEEARELGHDDIDTGHLLLGVLRQEGAPVVGCLHDLGVTLESARAAVERARPRQSRRPAGQMRFQPGAKAALEIALREAFRLRGTAIGCEHIVLGILGDESGPGAAILRDAEADVETLRQKVMPAIPLHLRAAPDPSYRVVLLEGDAEEWEKRLNDAVALGYELVEVIDRRAILRSDSSFRR